MSAVSISPIASFPVPIRRSSAADGGQTDPAQDSALTLKSSAAVNFSKNAQARLESEERFARYQSRINSNALKYFTAEDRRIIGEAYETAESRKRDMTKIDKLVHELAAFRIQQYMRGELVLAVVNQARDEGNEIAAPRRVDLAHLPLLGKIREMNGASG